ncbi:AAA family ATPase [Candidatus Woesearchaeota archaeon]|nr:AAA family ATPase [Candidatus Woesearchaeota archaeon]
MTEEKQLKLKVAEAIQDDVNKGIVRIDSSYMHEIGIRPGDIVEISGERPTVGIADRAYPGDIGLNIIRMDGVLRRNAKTGIGEIVIVKKAQIKEAKRVTIAPAQKGVVVRASPQIFKQGLLGRAVKKGDIVSLGGTSRRRNTLSDSPFFNDIFSMLDESIAGFGFSDLKFIVAETDPKQAVIITDLTEVRFNPEAVELKEEKVLEVTYEDVGGLKDELKKIREMVELPLKHPEIFERLGIEPPKGVLLHGPPGTGKTLLAKAVANETNSYFILINGPEIMCVDGSTELLTNPKGRKTVEDLFETAQKKGRIIHRDNHKEVIEPDEPIKLFSVNEHMEIVPQEVQYITKINCDKTYSVKTKRKGEFITSKNQPFAALSQEGELIWKKAEELHKGDLIAIAGKINGSKENPKIDFWNKLDKNSISVELNDGSILPLADVSSTADIKTFAYAKRQAKERVNYIKPITAITPLFAEFIGAMISEGYILEEEIAIAGMDKTLQELYISYFKELFGITHVKTVADKVTVYSSALSEMLVKGFGLEINKKQDNYSLPRWLLLCNEETIAAFIRGYYHGDGTQGASASKYPTPRIYSKSKQLLLDMQILLLRIGIVSTVKEWKTKLSLMHALEITDSGCIEEFYTIVKPMVKNSVYQQWQGQRVKFDSNERLPDLSKLLHNIKESLQLRYNHEISEAKYEPIISGRVPLTRRKLKELLAIFEKHKQPNVENELNKLRNIAKGVLRWDIITEIKQGESRTLYDISMKFHENFLGGSPLTVLHNSKFYGQSEANLRKKFEDAEKNAPAIIFIDEIDAIASKREEVHGEVERRVVAQLLAMMDGLQARGKVVVIAATNIPDSIDPALRRPGRFDREIEIGVPGKTSRLSILKIHTRNMPLDKDVDLKHIADITHGFVGADLSSLAKEAAMVVLRRLLPEMVLREDEPIPPTLLEKLKIGMNDFKEALKVVRPSAMREVLVEIPNVKWNDIGGLDEVKQELKEAVEWPLKFPDAFKRLGVKPPKGILLYGPPGAGKTLLAKAVANETEANFILVKGPELLSKWVGESERAVRKIFKKARQTSPTIIFFDEIDSLAPRRGSSADLDVTERVVNQLLTEMDGLEDLHDVVVIAATNRPDIIDTALLRPGRFDRIILASVSTQETREAIFRVHMKNMPVEDDVDIKELAQKTEGYVGADIEAICREAAIMALRDDMKTKKVPKKYFEKALEKVRPSMTKDIEEAYKEIQKFFRSARGKEMQENRPSYYG